MSVNLLELVSSVEEDRGTFHSNLSKIINSEIKVSGDKEETKEYNYFLCQISENLDLFESSWAEDRLKYLLKESKLNMTKMWSGILITIHYCLLRDAMNAKSSIEATWDAHKIWSRKRTHSLDVKLGAYDRRSYRRGRYGAEFKRLSESYDSHKRKNENIIKYYEESIYKIAEFIEKKYGIRPILM